jgi:fatty-acyl-CoA synthase
VGLAVVVPAPGGPSDTDALWTALRTRLAGFKVPRHIRFVEELPKTATGKIRKTDLRARFLPLEQRSPPMSG